MERRGFGDIHSCDEVDLASHGSRDVKFGISPSFSWVPDVSPAITLLNTMGLPNILWIDGVGGYALCSSQEVSIGQSCPGATADLKITGELGRMAASIRRVGEDHILRAHGPCTISDKPVDVPTVLPNRAKICLGKVELKYHRPIGLSSTAVLELQGNQRWQPLLSAALLLGDSFLLGPDSSCHIVYPGWSARTAIFRQGDGWFVRFSKDAQIEVNGTPRSAPFPLIAGQKIRGNEISMIME